MSAGQEAHRRGDLSAGFACFARAAELDPTLTEAWYMAGGMHVIANQPRQSMPYFERALSLKPDHPHALFEQGNSHLSLNEPKASLPFFRRSAKVLEKAAARERRAPDPLLATALSNLGNALNELGRVPEALVSFDRAVSKAPPTCLAYNGLSNTLEGAARYAEATAASSAGVRLLPSCEYAYYNLGRLLRNAGRNQEGAVAFRHASAISPADSLYVNGLGTALHASGLAKEAIAAYKHALRLRPTWSSPYRNLGLVAHEAGGRANEALSWFQKTVTLEPTSAETYCDMGTAYLELGQQVEALREYERARGLDEKNDLAHANFVYLSTKLCSWADLDTHHASLGRRLVTLFDGLERRRREPERPMPHLFLPPYHSLAYESRTPDDLLALASAYAVQAEERSGASTSRLPPPSVDDIGTRGRLVVGYLSTDFGDHPTSHLMRSFWQIQRTLRKVKAICFARSDDGSPQRDHIAQTCEEFVDLTGAPSWSAAADAIRKRKVHILVDLNGHCGRPQFEILSLRPAPLQISYMGHPGTSGADYIQYVLTDRVSTPPRARRHFSEHLLSLHQWHVTDYRFSHAFDKLGTPSSIAGAAAGRGRGGRGGAPPGGKPRAWPEEATRKSLGLPYAPSSPSASSSSSSSSSPSAAPFVMATFSQLYKVTPSFYQAWLNALQRSPVTARLWMLEFPKRASANLMDEAAANGVRVERLITAPTAQRDFHLARVSLADLFLDTAPYSGHTTTGDATWMGVPVLTLPGEMMQSRVAAGYAANAGCPQLAATHSLKGYEDLAASLAHKPRAVAKLRACLDRNRWTSAAFDTRKWVAAFDEGARIMWELHRNRLPAHHILLPARHVPGVG